MTDNENSGDEIAVELAALDDDLLVEALAHGMSHARAAELTLKSSKTVGRRKQNLEFRDRVCMRRRELREEAVGQIIAMNPRSLDILREGLTSDVWSIQFAAAKTILG